MSKSKMPVCPNCGGPLDRPGHRASGTCQPDVGTTSLHNVAGLVRRMSFIEDVIRHRYGIELTPASDMPGDRDYISMCVHCDAGGPTMRVSPANQQFYCPSCNFGGDVIRLIQCIENVAFLDAVELLASDLLDSITGPAELV